MESGNHFKNGANSISHTSKGILVLAILLIMSSYFVMGQSNTPIIGYDKVTWGVTIQKVKQFYPNMHLDIEIDNSRKIFEENVEANGITSREFYFYQDKLFGVSVYYDIDLKETLLNKIKSIYGKFDEKYFNDNGDEIRIINYSKNLIIKVSIDEDEIDVFYYDPTVYNKMDSDNIKL